MSQPTSNLTLPSPQSMPPSVHVRVVITWIALFPLVTLGSFAIAPFAADWNPILRAFILTALVIPVAVYIVMPRMLSAY